MADELQEFLLQFLKSEQTGALEAIIAGKEILAIWLTEFRWSLIYQVFCFAKISTAGVHVIPLLNNIVVEQVGKLNEIGLLVVQFFFLSASLIELPRRISVTP